MAVSLKILRFKHPHAGPLETQWNHSRGPCARPGSVVLAIIVVVMVALVDVVVVLVVVVVVVIVDCVVQVLVALPRHRGPCDLSTGNGPCARPGSCGSCGCLGHHVDVFGPRGRCGPCDLRDPCGLCGSRACCGRRGP